MSSSFSPFDPARVASYFRISEEFAEAAQRLAKSGMASVDPKQVYEIQKRNMDAVVAANRATAQVYEKLFRDQLEVVTSATQKAQESVARLREATADNARDPKAQAEAVREVMEDAIRQLSKLVEEAAKAHADALEALRQQAAESATELTRRTG